LNLTKPKLLDVGDIAAGLNGSHPYPNNVIQICMGYISYRPYNIGWYLMEYEDALLMRMVKEGRISIIQECKENEFKNLINVITNRC